MSEVGKKVWKVFVKIVKVLFAFIPIHEEIVNNGKGKTEN